MRCVSDAVGKGLERQFTRTRAVKSITDGYIANSFLHFAGLLQEKRVLKELDSRRKSRSERELFSSFQCMIISSLSSSMRGNSPTAGSFEDLSTSTRNNDVCKEYFMHFALVGG